MTTEPLPATDLRLQGLVVENVKRVKLVTIKPRAAAGVVEIAGKNGEGKSSTLDALMYALGGKETMPPKPLRTGATKGKAEVILSTKDGTPVLKITRSFVPTDSNLAVERIGQGGKISKPQEFLDAIAGAGLGFDPLTFMRLKPKDQVEQLLGMVALAEDPRALDTKRAEIFAHRTELNREAKRIEAQLTAMPAAEQGVPDVEVTAELVSVAALSQEQTRLATVIRDNDAFRAAVVEARASEAAQAAKVVELEAELARVQERLTAVHHAHARATEARENAEKLAGDLVDPDLSELTAQIAEAETTNARRIADADALNAKVRTKLRRREVTEQLLARQGEAETLTRRITQVDERKTELLAAAKFPIKGLAFELVGDAYAVTFNGQPLEQCSQSDQIKVCMAVAIAKNPGVRVILIRDGSLLDADSRALVDQLAIAQGFHVLMEVVGDGDPGAFVIEDGGVRDVAPAGKVAW